jgi:nitrogen regulatory protein P-II 1
MRRVDAFVPPHLVEDVKDRLLLVGVRGMTINPVTMIDYRQTPPPRRPVAAFIRMLVVAPDDMVETIVNAVMTVVRRDPDPDGRILVSPIIEAVRIRTGETGADAL